MSEKIISLIESITPFLCMVCANLSAIAIFYGIIESTKSNIPLHRRLKNWRFNCLAILYEEFNKARESSPTPEEAQGILLKKYKTNSLPFMNKLSMSPEQNSDVVFIGKVIENTPVLFYFMDIKSFGKKEYEKMLTMMNREDEEQIAYEAVRKILIDQSQSSVEDAMVWLPRLFTPPFIDDPTDSTRKIKKLENHFSVLEYTKGIYIKKDITQDSFMNALNALHRLNPSMEYASNKSHSSLYTSKINHNDNDKRSEKVLAQIKSICEKLKGHH